LEGSGHAYAPGSPHLDVRLKLYTPTPGAPQQARGVCFSIPVREEEGNVTHQNRSELAGLAWAQALGPDRF